MAAAMNRPTLALSLSRWASVEAQTPKNSRVFTNKSCSKLGRVRIPTYHTKTTFLYKYYTVVDTSLRNICVFFISTLCRVQMKKDLHVRCAFKLAGSSLLRRSRMCGGGGGAAGT